MLPRRCLRIFPKGFGEWEITVYNESGEGRKEFRGPTLRSAIDEAMGIKAETTSKAK
jgi:hypothetical protein